MSELKLTTAQGLEVHLELAHIGSRSLAFVLDWHLRVLLSMAWFLAALLIMGGAELLSQAFSNEAQFEEIGIWVLLPAGAIYLLYHPVLELLLHGSTPGKRMAGIRVVDLEGQRASAGAILIRNVLRIVDSAPFFYVIGLVCCALNRHHARIGDLAAGTLLAYDKHISSAALELNSNATQTLSLQHRALLQELLERWPQLSDAVRIRAAATWLSTIGDPEVPTAVAALKQRLERHARG